MVSMGGDPYWRWMPHALGDPHPRPERVSDPDAAPELYAADVALSLNVTDGHLTIVRDGTAVAVLSPAHVRSVARLYLDTASRNDIAWLVAENLAAEHERAERDAGSEPPR